MSPNLLMPNQEKTGYGEKEYGSGCSGDGDVVRGEEGGDEGYSSQLACPRLSVRTALCGAGVNTPMVRATSTPILSHALLSDLSATSSGLFASVFNRHVQGESSGKFPWRRVEGMKGNFQENLI